MKNVTVSDLREAIDAFEHVFDDEWRVPDVWKIQVDNFFCVNIYADNGRWYKYDPMTRVITQHSNGWRR